MQIIAKTKKSVFWTYFIVIICGVVMAVAGVVLSVSSFNLINVAVIVFGVVIIGMGGVFCFRIHRMPENVIVLQGDKLVLPDGACSINELINVTYSLAKGKGIQYSWGSIVLHTVNGQKKYDFIEDVESVHNKLIALMLKAKEN